MSAVSPAIGMGMVVKVNSNTMKATSFRRERSVGELPLPTSGLAANADGVYEIPNTTGGLKARYSLTGPYDTATPFHSVSFNLRPGKVVTVQVGMISTLLTPAVTFCVLSTTDENEAEQLGKWEAVLIPATDDTSGYFTEAA